MRKKKGQYVKLTSKRRKKVRVILSNWLFGFYLNKVTKEGSRGAAVKKKIFIRGKEMGKKMQKPVQTEEQMSEHNRK